jgi:hypothetical protein
MRYEVSEATGVMLSPFFMFEEDAEQTTDR